MSSVLLWLALSSELLPPACAAATLPAAPLLLFYSDVTILVSVGTVAITLSIRLFGRAVKMSYL
jgi:hypothetical protein